MVWGVEDLGSRVVGKEVNNGPFGNTLPNRLVLAKKRHLCYGHLGEMYFERPPNEI